MQEIAVYDLDGNTLTDLVQYDKDVYVCVKDSKITAAHQVQFFNSISESALIMDSTYSNGILKVKIPNNLLQQPHTITGYINVIKNGESKCLYGFRIAIRKKPCPNGYVYVDTKDYVTFAEIIAECREFATNAEASANKAKTSEIAASNFATNAKNSETAVADSAAAALKSANDAKASEENAKEIAENSEQSAKDAMQSAIDAKQSEHNAKDTEKSINEKIELAENYVNAAEISNKNASESEIRANEYAAIAMSYAIGEGSDYLLDSEGNMILTSEDHSFIYLSYARDGESTDNAKYYYEQSKLNAQNAKDSKDAATASATNAKNSETAVADSAAAALKSANDAKASKSASATSETNAKASENNSKFYYEQIQQIVNGLSGTLLPMGTIQFSDLANQTKKPGYMFNISDSFITNASFKEGADVKYSAGTNVYYTADGYWDCLSGALVTGVKGSKETDYRIGNVNLTPANIGAQSVENAEKMQIELNNSKEDIATLLQTVNILQDTISFLQEIIYIGGLLPYLSDDQSNIIVTEEGDNIFVW